MNSLEWSVRQHLLDLVKESKILDLSDKVAAADFVKNHMTYEQALNVLVNTDRVIGYPQELAEAVLLEQVFGVLMEVILRYVITNS